MKPATWLILAFVGFCLLLSGSGIAPAFVNPIPQSLAAYAPSAFDLSATAATNIKSSAGNVYGWFGFNPTLPRAICSFTTRHLRV